MKKIILIIGIVALFISVSFVTVGASTQFNLDETLLPKTTNDPEVLNKTFGLRGIICGYREEVKIDGNYTVIKAIYVIITGGEPSPYIVTGGTEISLKNAEVYWLVPRCNFLERLGIDTSNFIRYIHMNFTP